MIFFAFAEQHECQLHSGHGEHDSYRCVGVPVHAGPRALQGLEEAAGGCRVSLPLDKQSVQMMLCVEVMSHGKTIMSCTLAGRCVRCGEGESAGVQNGRSFVVLILPCCRVNGQPCMQQQCCAVCVNLCMQAAGAAARDGHLHMGNWGEAGPCCGGSSGCSGNASCVL